MATRIDTHAFAVVDDKGSHNVVVRTTPVSVDESGRETPVELGIELMLRDGSSVMPISETEFETANGTRWHLGKNT